jgi:hypothetical protein
MTPKVITKDWDKNMKILEGNHVIFHMGNLSLVQFWRRCERLFCILGSRKVQTANFVWGPWWGDPRRCVSTSYSRFHQTERISNVRALFASILKVFSARIRYVIVQRILLAPAKTAWNPPWLDGCGERRKFLSFRSSLCSVLQKFMVSGKVNVWRGGVGCRENCGKF